MPDQDQDVVSPASAGGASFPDEVRRRIWVAAEDLANAIGCTVVNAPAPLPPFKRRPVLKGPELAMDGDDEGNVWPDGVGWSLSWDCRLTFGRDEGTGEPTIVVNMSGEDLRRGIISRTVKRHQVAEFARLLAEQFGEPSTVVPDPCDAEIERLRGELNKANTGWEVWRDERRAHDKRQDNELRVVAERLHELIGDTEPCAMAFISARHLHGLLDRVVAEPPPEIERLRITRALNVPDRAYAEVVAERDRLRQELDRVAAQEPKAVAERDILAEAMVTMQGILKAADERLAGEGPAVEVVGTDV